MLSSIHDLSEATRREMDDIYIALAEMAKRRSKPEKQNPIDFVKITNNEVRNNNSRTNIFFR